jgi:hypothetical protein
VGFLPKHQSTTLQQQQDSKQQQQQQPLHPEVYCSWRWQQMQAGVVPGRVCNRTATACC